MSLSLIEELPRIVREGKAEVARIMERLSSPNRLTLQTNELVLPFKDQSGLFRGTVPDFKSKKELQEGGEWVWRVLGKTARPSAASGRTTVKTVREMPTSTWFTLIDPKVLGWRRACVKAVDVFGFENVVVKEVNG